MGAGIRQATADAGDGAGRLEVPGDRGARLTGQHRRQFGQDLGERPFVAARTGAGGLALEERMGERFDPLPRLGVHGFAAEGMHAPGPEEKGVHDAHGDECEG